LLRAVLWESQQSHGAEHVAIWRAPDGYCVESHWAGTANGEPALARYRLDVTPSWLVRRLLVTWSMPARNERLRVVRGADGRWQVNGEPRPDLIDCVDVDVAWSPLTNTLPIRRLGLEIGEGADLLVAYIAPPKLEVTPDGQRYSRLAPRRWLYQSLDSDFVAELEVDEDGLVVDYPPLFRRVAQWGR
jgi:uncharacterized protein